MGHQRKATICWNRSRPQGGVEALPKRLDRYGKAKNRALNISNFISDQKTLRKEYTAFLLC